MCLECEVNRIKTKGNLVKRPSMDAEEILENTLDEISQCETGEEVNPSEMSSTNAEVMEVRSHEAMPLSTGSLLYFVPGFVNVRNGAGTGFGITGSLSQGQFVAFQSAVGLDRSPTIWNNGWGWVRFANSNNWVAGWPGTGFNNATNGHLFAAHSRSFRGRIELPQVNFRTGPGTEYPTTQIGNFLSLPRGAQIEVDHFVARNSLPWSFTIPSRDLTQVWLSFRTIESSIGGRANGRGWVRADLVEGLPFDLIRPSSPIMGSINPLPTTVVVTAPALNKRSGASTHTNNWTISDRRCIEYCALPAKYHRR